MGPTGLLSLPTEIQQKIYKYHFEDVSITVDVSPQPYTTPMGRGVKTNISFPDLVNQYALVLTCRTLYTIAKSYRKYAGLTLDIREYTMSPFIDHLKRAILAQPQLLRLFQNCIRLVLWGMDGEVFNDLRQWMPMLRTLRLVDVHVDYPAPPPLWFKNLSDLSRFISGNGKELEDETQGNYEQLIRTKGSWAVSSCLAKFTGQDFEHRRPQPVSLAGLDTEVAIVRSDLYTIGNDMSWALLITVTASAPGGRKCIMARRADDWLRLSPPEDKLFEVCKRAVTQLALKRKVTTSRNWFEWSLVEYQGQRPLWRETVDVNARWIRAANLPSCLQDIV
ncbi:hypothetical protein LTR64_005457 [Lithohypha guttulata]|uniref:uncharacterized protein n=1 Tax=Lithohypha guttulata TaxID=1690604 RepID=UPI002DDE1B68|nr:hypothetical protein LTR51_002750 [Lithohypha guttulata]